METGGSIGKVTCKNTRISFTCYKISRLLFDMAYVQELSCSSNNHKIRGILPRALKVVVSDGRKLQRNNSVASGSEGSVVDCGKMQAKDRIFHPPMESKQEMDV